MKQTKKEMMQGVNDVVSSKVIENNTIRYTTTDNRDIIRLHNTDVVTKWPNGYITLNSGGWRTVTTKDRINSYSNIRVYSKRGIWYVKDDIPFFDGITFNSNGECLNPISDGDNEQKRLLKLIDKYIAECRKLDSFPMPSNGDCWYCMMHTQDGKSLGEATDNKDHLMSHLEEKYIHGSLVVNALKAAGYNETQLGYVYRIKDIGIRAIRRYFKNNLGIQG